jgi:hypothetical protein
MVIGFGAVQSLVSGKALPRGPWSRIPEVLGAMGGIGLVLGLGLFGIGWIWATRVTADTVQSSSLSGRLILISKSSIRAVRPITIQGFPALLIESDESDATLFMYTLGLDRDTVYARLCGLIGPENLLTQAFRPL